MMRKNSAVVCDLDLACGCDIDRQAQSLKLDIAAAPPLASCKWRNDLLCNNFYDTCHIDLDRYQTILKMQSADVTDFYVFSFELRAALLPSIIGLAR